MEVRDIARDVAVASLVAARRVAPVRRTAPDFVVVGAQKAGTSTLMARLGAHPQVLSPLVREVHYFDLHHRRPTGWYEAHFATVAQHRQIAERHGRAVTGESSPYYLMHPFVPARLHARYPDMALIVILRDPVARAVSHYHHAVRHGFERRPIEQALDVADDAREEATLDERAFDDPRGRARRFLYVARGHYAEQLDRWLQVFPRDRLLVLTNDQLRDGTAVTEACAYLGLDRVDLPPVADRNVQRYDPPGADVVDALRAHYADHDRRLAALLGRSLPWASDDTEQVDPTTSAS